MPDDFPLDIELDARFQRKAWVVERIGWAAFALFLAAAGLGLLGGTGPFARTAVTQRETRIEYGRFARMQSPVMIEIAAPTDADGALRIRVGGEYLRDFTIDSVVPEPARSSHDEDGVEFAFEARPTSLVSVLIRGKVDSPGVKHAEVLVNGEPLSFRQVVYP